MQSRLRLELAVTGMHVTDSFVRDVFLCSEEHEEAVGKIDISEGKGSYRQQWSQLGNIGGSGISYEELCGIRIPLGAGREISCHWPLQGRDAGKKAVSGNPEMRAAESGSSVGSTVYGRDEKNTADRGGENAAGGQNRERADGFGRDGSIVAEIRDGKGRISAGGDESNAPGTPNSRETDRKDRAEREPGGYRNNGFGTKADPDKELAAEIRNDRGRDTADMEEKRTALWKDEGEDFTGIDKGGFAEPRNKMDGEFYSREEKRVIETAETGWIAEREKRVAETAEAERVAEREQKSGSKQKAAPHEQKPVKLLESKWAQLWAIYPHIRPFNDEREYISIGPSDFVLFPEASYKMANNSFLLHGFYNYKHLLLARMERKGETLYYIGVPGTFFEKEKQVAIMFGFESFECAEEPAQAGDFGYYMMRTGL